MGVKRGAVRTWGSRENLGVKRGAVSECNNAALAAPAGGHSVDELRIPDRDGAVCVRLAQEHVVFPIRVSRAEQLGAAHLVPGPALLLDRGCGSSREEPQPTAQHQHHRLLCRRLGLLARPEDAPLDAMVERPQERGQRMEQHCAQAE
eukprot:scaffold7775_cov101-Isochrysis_galbana.AAC.2